MATTIHPYIPPAVAGSAVEPSQAPSKISQLWTKATAWLSTSTPVKSIQVEQQEIAQRSGEFWECLSREKGALGGFIYKFRLQGDFDDVTPNENRAARTKAAEQKSKKMFPAIELTGSQMLALDPNVPESELRPGTLKIREHLQILMQLGYRAERKEDGVYLYLPDREALLTNWETLRATHPDLPELTILSSEGIAGDIDYVKAYFTHDGILSTGKEFLHDHQAHILSVIVLILSSGKPSDVLGQNPTYRMEKSRMVLLLGKAYRRVMIARELCKTNFLKVPDEELALLKKHLPKIEATLGSFADILSSKDRYTATLQWKEKSIYGGDS
ncbi:MAG TPA: hypothetical protein VIJ46_02110, partial [Rhabdochlamydiaceae bacterium]